MSSSKQFVVDRFKTNFMNLNIDLLNDTFKIALCNSFTPTYSAWASGTSYSEGDIVIPSTRNGHRYRATNSGTSGSSEPTWPTTTGSTVVDNEITWEEYGGEHANNEFWDDVSANEVTDGDGYSVGGITLSSQTIWQNDTDPMATQWNAADVTWTSLTKTMRHAFLYVAGDTPGTNDYLISYILLNDAPADITVNGADFTIQFNIEGIVELGR